MSYLFVLNSIVKLINQTHLIYQQIFSGLILLDNDESTLFKGFKMFFSYVIILNTVVPISLYVSIEFIRLGQSYFINQDMNMYYEKKGIPAKARTTTLNEVCFVKYYNFLLQQIYCFKFCFVYHIE